MKKIIAFTVILLSFALFSAGCGTTPTENLPKNQVSNPLMALPPPNFLGGNIGFDHPSEWQILTLSDNELVQPYKEAAETLFEGPVTYLKSIEINFSAPHEIGAYDRTNDVTIQDIALETPPDSIASYLEKVAASWGQEGGQTELYTSPSHFDFTLWSGQSSTFDAAIVIYVTDYTDTHGIKHFVQIWRMGTDVETIKSALKPIIDTFAINPETGQ